jgi:hypothetical protein
MGQTTAGSLLEVTMTAPATESLTGFEALSDFTEVGEVADLGEYGKDYTLITRDVFGSRRTQKYKGNYDAGSTTWNLNKIFGDAGQEVIDSAVDSDSNMSVKLTHQDGTIDYFAVLVTSATNAIDDPNTVFELNVDVELNTDVYRSEA